MIDAHTHSWVRQNGFNPQQLDAPGKYQDTPLILACRQGEEEMVRALLSEGVNIHHRNMDGTNALWAAVVARSFSIAQLLLDNGADIDNQNDNGASVLMYASSNGMPDWVKFLIEHGADTRLESLDGFTALDLANTLETLRILRKAV